MPASGASVAGVAGAAPAGRGSLSHLCGDDPVWLLRETAGCDPAVKPPGASGNWTG